ncbi:cell wall-binding repeat-containing protein [Leifsonia sp. ZF2019]|uniref:cell wall-binding repeat-containing protein n=1 Tax=Leifsonia sp. ZF2019 TaxID=2781978 RepID=UPI001CBFC743|nr:cell wall-binding repeat-containing protein [Leifsonia sp. ZF2019]UAJ80552.1 cell wall-binding repeat-containing protein [Leifsonia sp. ZF2019]
MLNSRRRAYLGALALAIVASLLAVAAVTTPAQAAPSAAARSGVSASGQVKAAVASDFQPGYIISDYNFYNGQALDVGSIQAFLNAQVPTCRAGYTCLKDYRETTGSRAADPMCAAYTGAANETAATIIAKVGAACGISQKVLLVLLQKEQSLVTDTWPTTSQYQKATGFACPDTSACDPSTLGFYNQVYKAAWQYKRYGNPPGTSNYFTWIPVGQVSAIRYSPTASCGSSNVLVRNAATAALYYYTPYQPNAAALANLYGTGDGCSAYGNRNFWRLFTDWFGSATGGVAPIGNFESAALTASAFTVSGWTFDQSQRMTSLNVQITWNTPAGVSTTTVAANASRPDVANAYPGAGALHGFSASVPRAGEGQYSACVTPIATAGNPGGNGDLGCRTVFYSAAATNGPAMFRVQGTDRFETSVAASKSAYPNGRVPVVYIASGVAFADAITAGPAASVQGGPLLLTTPDAVPATVLAEVKRLAPKRIVIVGGPNAISGSVQAALAAVQPDVVRLAGSDRFETSQAIASYAFPTATSAYFASGMTFPDALSASSTASASRRPIILVSGFGAADASTRAFAAKARLTSATVVGGSAAVSAAFDGSLPGVAMTRIGGSDRFETSQLLSASQFSSASTVFIASGIDFPDALSGSVLAAASGAPLFVSQTRCLPRVIGNAMVKLKTTRVYLIGGPASLSADVAALRPC